MNPVHESADIIIIWRNLAHFIRFLLLVAERSVTLNALSLKQELIAEATTSKQENFHWLVLKMLNYMI